MYKIKTPVFEGTISLLEFQKSPQLIQGLVEPDFWTAWRDAVTLAGQIEELTHEFEREAIRRLSEKKKGDR